MRWLVALVLAPAAALAQQTPLDVSDPTPRDVVVQVETSRDLATVGQSFAPPVPATYSASGGIGTLVIPVESHIEMRAGGLPPVPESFTPIVIHIDLATLAATSEPASGEHSTGAFGYVFTQNPLGSAAPGGFLGPSFPTFFCESQQQVTNTCPFFPPICGETCHLVPGSPYDPATGKVNLIGYETQEGCDGTFCPAPIWVFSPQGDLRLLEANVVPALPWPAAMCLSLLLLAAAASSTRIPRAHPLRHQRRPR